MYLHLNICELELWLRIDKVRISQDGDDWSNHWCDVELRLQSEYISYDNCGELLLGGEVMYIRESLRELINGEMTQDTTIDSCEPDLRFHFKPAKRLYSDPPRTIYKNGYKDIDMQCDFVVNFWDGRLPRNSFVTRLERFEIEALYVYLRLVTGEISRDDDAVVKLIDAQVLVEE